MNKVCTRFQSDGLEVNITATTPPVPATEALHDQLTTAKRRKRTVDECNDSLSMTLVHSSLPFSFAYNHRGSGGRSGGRNVTFQRESPLPFPVIDYDSSFISLDEEFAPFSDTSTQKSLLDESSLGLHSSRSCSKTRIRKSACHGMVRSGTILSSICALDLVR
jgi:hypothetical protein